MISLTCPGRAIEVRWSECDNDCYQRWFDGSELVSFFCDKDKCVRDVCEGRQPQCEDETDLKYCQDKNVKNTACGGNKKRCNQRFPGQCVDDPLWKDGKYHCLDRSDEPPVRKQESPQQSDMKFVKCNYTSDGKVEEGFLCNDQCVARSYWCLKNFRTSKFCKELGHRLTSDPNVCSNQSFWLQQPCREGAYHCKGRKNAQCADEYRRCEDKSDQVFHVGHPCNMTSNGRDVLNCTGSCSSADCLEGACSNPAYPRCSKDEKCYNPELRCDMHPACSDGKDEENCTESYVKKNYFPAGASSLS